MAPFAVDAFLEERTHMGNVSQRHRLLGVVLLIAVVLAAGPLACSSPIPSHFTVRTGPPASPTLTATSVPPTYTSTATLTETPAPSPTPMPSDTPTSTPSPTKSTPRKYTRTPTLTPTPTLRLPRGEVHYDDESGFAVVLPEDWIAGKEGDVTSMAVSEAVWLSDAPNDPLVIVTVGPLDEIFGGALAKARSPEDVLLVAGGSLGREWDAKLTSVTETTFDDYEAASGLVEDDNAERSPQLTGSATAVLLDGRAALVWAVAPEDQWEEFEGTLNAILNSITFTEPTYAPVERTPTRAYTRTPTSEVEVPTPGESRPTIKRPPAVPSPTAPQQTFSFGEPEDLYVNDWENYSILTPKDWRVYIEEGTLTIAPTADDFSLEVIRSPMVEVTVGSLSSLWDGAASGTTEPRPLFDVAAQVQAERGINIVGSVQTAQIAGYPAVTAELAGQGLGGQLTSIYLGESRAALIGVLAPVEQWPSFAPIFQVMSESLQFNVQ